MGLSYRDLDDATRLLMVEEIDADIADGTIYLSRFLSPAGVDAWPVISRQAAANGTDDSLAMELGSLGRLNTHYEKRKPKGGTTVSAVPYTAPQTMAEAQFNLYVMRALARRALETGQKLLVYRGKEVEHPRSESERMIGTHVPPAFLLEELRRTKGVEPATGMPLPNSGLCVRLD